jgi:hypothetical protein
MLLSDLPKQSVTPEAAVHQHQVVGPQSPQQPMRDRLLVNRPRSDFVAPRQARPGEGQHHHSGLWAGDCLLLAVLGGAEVFDQTLPARQRYMGPVEHQEAEVLPAVGLRMCSLESLGQDDQQPSPERQRQSFAGLHKCLFGDRTESVAARGVLLALLLPFLPFLPVLAFLSPLARMRCLALAPQRQFLPTRLVGENLQSNGQHVGERPANVHGCADCKPRQHHDRQRALADGDSCTSGRLDYRLAAQEAVERRQVPLTDLIPYRTSTFVREHLGVLLTELLVEQQLVLARPRFSSRQA